ncbi:UDP-N-acetylglucosamine 2-epimerase (non-hydrolyzing) [Candidatus Sumerlaeota bacterium]|nr:UDP-N-acetylglucosamine 2-epimerase (non-hydrolyzing) [Candidatus Sumerlaeota bacterium]
MSNPLKIMIVFGTRPEAIKLAPLIQKARLRPDAFHTIVVVTAQHRRMLDDVLYAFDIQPDLDLNIMTPGQTLFGLTSRIFAEMEIALQKFDPDIVMVQGDTTTAFAGAISGYYARKKIAYVEAGLRTGNKWEPFPEEINRKAASTVADFMFAPTKSAKENLLREGYEEKNIFVTGNTVIDALYWMKEKVKGIPCPVPQIAAVMGEYEKMVLITGHRRENFGEPFRRIFRAFQKLAENHPDVCFVYPVHLNPNVQGAVEAHLKGLGNFLLLPPLSYPDFVWMMNQCHLIITDSGGIQEEAPALDKPVLVTRRVTERPEALSAGVVKLVGDDEEQIFLAASLLLRDENERRKMAKKLSPYGDGRASERILDILQGMPVDDFEG